MDPMEASEVVEDLEALTVWAHFLYQQICVNSIEKLRINTIDSTFMESGPSNRLVF